MKTSLDLDMDLIREAWEATISREKIAAAWAQQILDDVEHTPEFAETLCLGLLPYLTVCDTESVGNLGAAFGLNLTLDGHIDGILDNGPDPDRFRDQ